MGWLTRTYLLRWPANDDQLRAIAHALHDKVRAIVTEQVQRGETVVFVSGGVASPPGPPRLLLEDRRRGLPGRRLRAILSRARDAIELRVETSRLRPVPLELLAPLLTAARAVAADDGIDWLAT